MITYSNTQGLLVFQRLKEMRQLTKDPNAATKARAAELKANEEAGLKSIDLSSLSSSTAAAAPGKKKPVWKSVAAPESTAPLKHSPAAAAVSDVDQASNDPSGAIKNGWYEDRYQPQFVTGCENGGCTVCKGGMIDLTSIDREVTMTNA